jgi:hypothetical protein
MAKLWQEPLERYLANDGAAGLACGYRTSYSEAKFDFAISKMYCSKYE